MWEELLEGNLFQTGNLGCGWPFTWWLLLMSAFSVSAYTDCCQCFISLKGSYSRESGWWLELDNSLTVCIVHPATGDCNKGVDMQHFSFLSKGQFSFSVAVGCMWPFLGLFWFQIKPFLQTFERQIRFVQPANIRCYRLSDMMLILSHSEPAG